MPTYVYECNKCGEDVEIWQSFTDDPLKRHPHCGGKLTKVYQPVGIVLKGSGFYKTDSRNGKKSETGADRSESSSPDSGNGSKPESGSGSTSERSEKSEKSESKDSKKPGATKSDAKKTSKSPSKTG